MHEMYETARVLLLSGRVCCSKAMGLDAAAEARLGWAAQQEAEALAAELRAAADRLEKARGRGHVRAEGVRGVIDVDLAEMLEPCRDAQEALEKRGGTLLALAALGGAPMERLAWLTGKAETSIPNWLARTELLRPFAGKGSAVPRVGLAGLKAARTELGSILQQRQD